MLCLSCGKDAVYEVVGHPRFPEPVGMCPQHLRVYLSVRDGSVMDYDNLSEEEITLWLMPTSEDPLYGKRVRCRECRKRHTLKWNGLVNSVLHKAKLCFDCHFWVEKIGMEGAVIVNHVHFHIGEEFEGVGFRGHGGRLFRVYFFTGHVQETSNLWCQGNVPEHFWDRLPDNARLIAEDTEWEELIKRYPPMP
jgi:hypothetical protein